MALRVARRGFAMKVPNVNVTDHNVERRPGMTKFSFINTFNMGYEGFSEPLPLARMHPVWGMKGEYILLMGTLIAIPLFSIMRKKKESLLRGLILTNNRYAMVQLSHTDRRPCTWDL